MHYYAISANKNSTMFLFYAGRPITQVKGATIRSRPARIVWLLLHKAQLLHEGFVCTVLLFKP